MKKVMNEKTVKTAAIGLSAIIAMSTPVTAMAAEGENSSKNNNTENSTTESKQNLESEVENLQNTASALTEEKTDTNTGTGEVKEAEKKEEAAVNSTKGENINQDVKNKANDLKTVTTGEKTNSDESKKVVNKATDQVEETENKLYDAKNEAQKVDSAVEEAENIVDDVNSIAKKANEKIDGAIINIENKTKEINNAANLKDAENAANAAQNEADAANKELAEAVSKLAKAQTDFNLAKTKAENAEKAYKKALEEAEGNSSAAVNELKAASEAANALKEEAQKAVDAAKLNAEDQAALNIIKKQQEIQNMDPKKWWHEDQLFQQIMNDYYIPNVLQKTVGEGSTIKLDENFTKSVDSKDSRENYIRAIITDKDGNETVRYFNYDLDDSGKSMVIFEKNESSKTVKEFDYKGNENYEKYLSGDQTAEYFSAGTDEAFENYLENESDEKIKQNIIDKRNYVKKYPTAYWHADILFNMVMKNYYIPQVIKPEEGTTASLGEWERLGGKKNYIPVVIKDANGKEIRKEYYNYKIDQRNGDLIIFEKVDVYKDVQKKIYVNDNYDNYKKKGSKEGILLIEKEDQGLNDYLNAVREKEAKLIAHQTVVNAAAEAEKQAKVAEEKVNALKEKIRALKEKTTTTAADLIALQKDLDDAENNLGGAKEKVYILNEKLKESKEALKQAEIKFTPEPTPSGEKTNPVPSNNPAPAALTLSASRTNVIQPVRVPLAGGAGVPNINNENVVNNGNGENNPVVIDDENTPLAANVKDLSNDIATTIEDSELPLADAPVAVMSWWWLIVVALLGATGYEMYRRHKLQSETMDIDI